MFGHRPRLFAGASLAAIATLAAYAPAHAQAFQGTPNTVLGNVSYNRGSPGVETVTVNTPQATINWTPTDTATSAAPIVFLPNGNVATYVSGTGAAYTVLNRIIATDQSRPIQFDGAVNSDALGSLWFYAPGGILLSPTAQFNIGSLLLTSADPIVDVNGFFLTGSSYSLAAPAGASGFVQMQTGSQVTATAANSYVVMFGPKVSQAGTINVNGSAAIVAAESADFTFNAGLFDITVTRGTDVGNTAFGHSGTTTGPAAAAGENHRIYLVAVPKNVALSMAIIGNGQLGFDIAGAANVDGNTVVLSAGHNVRGVAGSADPFVDAPASATAATFDLTYPTVTSNLTGRATDQTRANASTTSNFASNITLRGGNVALFGASPGATLNVAGNVTLSAVARNLAGTAGANRTGGNANFYASANGTVTVGGSVTIDASGYGDLNSTSGSGGLGTGGAASLNATGGNFTVNGSVSVIADGTGGGNLTGTGPNGGGVGGSALIFAHDDQVSGSQGLLTIGGAGGVLASANAFASAVTFGGTDGGNATAGQATIIANFGGSLVIVGDAIASGRAVGGTSFGGTLIGGTATGSSRSQIDAQLAGSTLSIGGSATVDTSATGGDGTIAGGAGGTGTGGLSQLEGQNGGTLTVAGNATVRALGTGGDGSNGAAGGAGVGGQASTFGGGGTTRFSGTAANILYQATGQGGAGATGGVGNGGTTSVSTNGAAGLIDAGGATWLQTAAGVGGNATAGAGGAGTGGTATLIAGFGAGLGTITLGPDTQIRAQGIGGTATGGAGGAATGGTLNLTAQSGATITLPGTLDMQTNATGATSTDGAGGGAVAGNTSINVTNASLTVQGATTLSSRAIGGNAGALSGAAGGNATAGGVATTALSGTLGAGNSTISLQTYTENVTATGGTGGSGAAGIAGGRGGDATGGNAGFIAQSRNGQITATIVTADGSATAGAGGTGGAGAVGGRGGDAQGGFIGNHGTASGPVGPVMAGYNRTTSMTLTANAIGGAGGAGGTNASGGHGGDATAGNAGVLARGSEVTTGAANLTANSTGGAGGAGAGGALDGDGGNALAGGAAGVLATPQFNNGNAATVSLASLTATNIATGGASGTGTAGSAAGGEAYVRLEQTQPPGPQVPNTGTLGITGAANLIANATGGNSTTGTAGAATGGVAHFVSVAGTMTLGGAANATANGTGGTLGTGGVGGAGTGGTAEILVDGNGRMDVTNRFNGMATGAGSNGLTGTGGVGRGGIVNAQIAVGSGTLNLNAGTQLIAQGLGGAGAAGGGAGVGGNAFAGTVGAGNFTDATGTNIQLQGIGGASSGALGGAATGGIGNAGANAGTARFNGTILVVGAASGGSSGAGVGGAATGGQANVRSAAGATIVAGTITASAVALGGASSAGSGGAATGGSATIGTLQSAGAFTGNGAVTATGVGTGGAGAGAGSTGGAGTGGLAQVLGFGATTINNTVQLAASGSGGTGAAGGAGTGGIARAIAVESAIAGGNLTFTGAANIAALGTGGAGLAGFGGTGGNGTGGSSLLSISATNFNSQLTAAGATQSVSGTGGAGGSGAAGQAGGRGGGGIGGLASSGSTSSAGTIVAGALIQTSNGIGGIGGAGGTGAVGGAGGAGTGGNVGIGNNVNGASTLTGNFTWASFTGNSSGFGGTGGTGGSGAGGGAGGAGTGGYAPVGINGGTMTISGATQLSANGRGGSGGLGTVQGAGGNGMGGNAGAGVGAHFVAGGTSNLVGGTLFVNAGGFAGNGSTAGASVAGTSVVIASSGNVRFAGTTLLASGQGAPTVPSPLGLLASGLNAQNGTITITGDAILGNDFNTDFAFGANAAIGIDNGAINIGGNLVLYTSRNIVPTLAGTLPPNPGTATIGGSALIFAGGTITMPTNFTIAQTFDFTAGSSATLGNLRAGFDVDINTDGNVVTGTISAGDSIAIDSQASSNFGAPSPYTITTGNLDAGIVGASTDPNAGYQVGLSGNAGVNTGTIRARGNIGIAAPGGSIATGAITTTKTIALIAGTAVTTGALTGGTAATDYIYISNPSIFTADPNLDATGPASSFDFAPYVVLTPQRIGGAVTINGAITTGNFRSASTGAFAAQAALGATRTISIDTGATASFGGIADAPTITVSAADIAIATGAGLGSATTTLLTLNVDPSATAITFGGAAAAGWSLDSNEVSRLRARRIVLDASRPAVDVRLGTLSLVGSAGATPNLVGTGATLSIQTPRSIRVTGAVAISSAAASDTLQLSAGNRIDIVTDQGGALRLSDAGGAPAGILDLTARDLLAADATLIGQLTANPAFAGRDAALAATPAIPDLNGALVGGQITISSGNSVLIQNSGSLFQRGGFTTGPAGLRISAQNGAAGAPPIDVVVNGRIFDATGTALTNDQTINGVTLQPSASGRAFSTNATVNGCKFNAICLSFDNPVTQTITNIGPDVQQLTEDDREKLEAASAEAALAQTPQVRVEKAVNVRAVTAEPVIQDPVAGSGNASLWATPPSPSTKGDDK